MLKRDANMITGVAVCGQICSGKSYLIKHLSSQLGWDVISFGDYVRHVASLQHIEPSRESFQALGQRLISERGPTDFLADVILFNHPGTDNHLYDGVRHIPIVQALGEIYDKTLVVYLSVPDDQRYGRYLERLVLGDSVLSFQEFLEMGLRPTECGIPQLANVADLCLDATQPVHLLVDEIHERLRRLGAIAAQ